MCFIQHLTVYFLPLNILILAKCFTVEKLPHDFFSLVTLARHKHHYILIKMSGEN